MSAHMWGKQTLNISIQKPTWQRTFGDLCFWEAWMAWKGWDFIPESTYPEIWRLLLHQGFPFIQGLSKHLHLFLRFTLPIYIYMYKQKTNINGLNEYTFIYRIVLIYPLVVLSRQTLSVQRLYCQCVFPEKTNTTLVRTKDHLRMPPKFHACEHPMGF